MPKIKAPTFITTTTPGVGDDAVDGFSTGWLWFNTVTRRLWLCVSANVGAADWIELNPAAGTGTVNSVVATPSILIDNTDAANPVASGGNMFSIVDWGTLNTTTPAGSTTGSFTVGCEFQFTKLISCLGARFYWPSATNRTVRLELWQGGAVIKTVDVTTSGIGNYSGTFASKFSPVAGDLYKTYKMTMWDTIGGASGIFSNITDAEAGTRKPICLNVPLAPGYILRAASMNIAGHATTLDGTQRYLVEPTFGNA
jgi:hypothetical protein